MQQTSDTDFGFGPGFAVKLETSPKQPQTDVNIAPAATETFFEVEKKETTEIEYFSQEFSQGSVALVERFGTYSAESVGSPDASNKTGKSVALFGFPFEIAGEYELERRIGIELGPEKIFAAIKSSGLRSIEDPHCRYYEFLSNLPPPGAIILEDPSTVKVFFSEGLLPFDTVIGFGGGNHLLNTFFAHIDKLPTRRVDRMVKISPKISRKPILTAKLEAGDNSTPPPIIHNNNYATALDQSAREKTIHFGVIDSEASQAEVNLVLNKDGSKVVYLDKTNRANCENFSALVNSLVDELKTKPNTTRPKIGLMIDCESIKGELVPGVSSPAIFGLNTEELQGIFNRCVQPDVQLSVVLLTNFNPAIETDRSSRYLAFMIHSLLEEIKSSINPET